MAKYQLVIFDLDGVLLDSKANMQASWQAVQTALSTTIPFERYFSEIGKPFADIMDQLGLGSSAREAERVYVSTSLKHGNLLRWFAGTEEMLLALQDQGIKLAIVTSKDRQRTVKLVERLPVDFSAIHAPTPGLRGKPAPDHLLVACAEANVDPSDAIFVGDMPVDHQAAQRAHMRFAYASWGYGTVEAPDMITFGNTQDIVVAVLGDRK